MAVTARNAWNVARHAAPAQSHGAIHRPFGPLPIRFRCPSSFCHWPPAQTANQAAPERAKIAPPRSCLLFFPSLFLLIFFFLQIYVTSGDV